MSDIEKTTRALNLDLDADVVSLAQQLCDIPSVSGLEGPIADVIEGALSPYPHLEVLRDGNAVVARTNFGRNGRVIIAGHLDTVPIAGNVPSRLEGDTRTGVLWGRGSTDMKSGVAVQLKLARDSHASKRDITFIFYDNEEVEASLNGLGRLSRNHPEWLVGDFAVLCEPSNGGVEAGCQGSMQLEVRTKGLAAHSARPWTGCNAIHAAGRVLLALHNYKPREVSIDNLVFRESLSAVGISGGIAMNVVPDLCVIRINYRFAPDRSIPEAEAHMRDVFAGYDVVVTDVLPAAPPGIRNPAVASFLETVGGMVAPKLGWTDVAHFTELGVPAVNFGPGDPLLAHTDNERCSVSLIVRCELALRDWLDFELP